MARHTKESLRVALDGVYRDAQKMTHSPGFLDRIEVEYAKAYGLVNPKPMAGCGPYLVDWDGNESLRAQLISETDQLFIDAIDDVRSGRISQNLRREMQEALKAAPKDAIDAPDQK